MDYFFHRRHCVFVLTLCEQINDDDDDDELSKSIIADDLELH